jgi:hypothetical protein
MTSPATAKTSVRRIISSLVVAAIFGVFLSIYFLKYVPQQKRDYNRRAFVELGSVTDALNKRDEAFLEVVKNLQNSKTDTNTLDELLRIFPESKQQISAVRDLMPQLRIQKLIAGQTSKIEWDPAYHWGLTYPANLTIESPFREPVHLSLRKSIDSLMLPLVAGDNDVFDSYLLILDSQSRSKDTPNLRKGEIIFNPGQLSLDYLVNIDTLLKKSDGFSLPGINDVTIEGNDYKLFLYPFRLHQGRAIMAGLLSSAHYTQRYEEVPIAFITTGTIILLLLLVALPLLKIYILGPTERITNLDLRLIITSYYVGGFVLFFLFAWNFLAITQNNINKDRLRSFAHTLQENLTGEIHATCLQLRTYDILYQNNSALHAALTRQKYDSTLKMLKNSEKDRWMHPAIYKQFDAIFWAGESGWLTARYAMMRYRDIPLVDISDRDYFNDMRSGRILTLPGESGEDSFCLQPTLDKLDGRYVVNIVIPSHPTDRSKDSSIMIGSSGQPYSIYNTALPPGYGFSIVDQRGTILFDSRKGRHLLSNIATDISDEDAIAQCIRYRKERFFASSDLHGNNTTLLVTPMTGLPYVSIVYCEREESDKFQLYVLGLTLFFVGSIILLLILSTFCNEWGNRKSSLSGIPPVNFDWLRPGGRKQNYYRHLIIGMGCFTGIYGFFWLIFESFFHRQELFLFVTSILFPFFVAIHYFLLREKQKHPRADFRKTIPWPAVAIPSLAILVIFIYVICTLKFPIVLSVIGIQVIFIFLIKILLDRLPVKPHSPNQEKTQQYYSSAVVAGVLTIIIVPAVGIFSFFYKEETRTATKEEMLGFASIIENRKNCIGALKNPEHYWLDSTDHDFINSLLHKKGIYYVGSFNPTDQKSPDQDLPLHHPGLYYGLRNFLFPKDTTILTYGDDPDRAEDGSWYFHQVRSDSEVLVHTDIPTGLGDTVRLPLSAPTRMSALKLMVSRLNDLNLSTICFFFLILILLIILFQLLTTSLAIRIFLLRVLTKFPAQIQTNRLLMDPTSTSPFAISLKNEIETEMNAQWSAKTIRNYEEKDLNYRPLYVRTELENTYKAIWTPLSTEEKFVLFDFALDGLTNYKAGLQLFNLIRKGILYIDRDKHLHVMTRSFQNYVISQAGTDVIVQQMKKAKAQGSWQHFRVPVLLVISAAGIFVFLTQEAAYQKITGLFTSLSTLLPLITQFFDKSNK